MVHGFAEFRIVVHALEKQIEMTADDGRERLNFLAFDNVLPPHKIERFNLLGLSLFKDLEILKRQGVDESIAVMDPDGDIHGGRFLGENVSRKNKKKTAKDDSHFETSRKNPFLDFQLCTNCAISSPPFS